MYKLLKTIIFNISYCYFISITFANNDNISNQHKENITYADQRFAYIGARVGLSAPITRKFTYHGINHDMGNSLLYGINLGYSFYPQMAIECSISHNPRYDLKLHMPQSDSILTRSSYLKKTTASSKTYMINLVYSFQNFKDPTPFVIGGIGLSRINVNAMVYDTTIGTDLFKLERTYTNCFTWQVGLGLLKNITDNLLFTSTAQFHTIHNAKIKYKIFDVQKEKITSHSPFSKMIKTMKFSVGFIYKIPL